MTNSLKTYGVSAIFVLPLLFCVLLDSVIQIANAVAVFLSRAHVIRSDLKINKSTTFSSSTNQNCLSITITYFQRSPSDAFSVENGFPTRLHIFWVQIWPNVRRVKIGINGLQVVHRTRSEQSLNWPQKLMWNGFRIIGVLAAKIEKCK